MNCVQSSNNDYQQQTFYKLKGNCSQEVRDKIDKYETLVHQIEKLQGQKRIMFPVINHNQYFKKILIEKKQIQRLKQQCLPFLPGFQYQSETQNYKLQQIIFQLYKYVIKELIVHFQSWDVELFSCVNHKNTQILKNISQINMIQLKILLIKDAQIDSLQPLGWFNAPNLTQLSIFNRNITKTKPLSKLNFSFLAEIRLNNINYNSVQLMSSLQRCKIRSQCLKYFSYQFNQIHEIQIKYRQNTKKLISNTITPLVKIQSKKFQNIRCCCYKIQEVQGQQVHQFTALSNPLISRFKQIRALNILSIHQEWKEIKIWTKSIIS